MLPPDTSGPTAGNGGQVPVVGFFHQLSPVPHPPAVLAVRKKEFGNVCVSGTELMNALGLPELSLKLAGTSLALEQVVDQPGLEELPHQRTVVVEHARVAPHPAVTLSQLPQRIIEACVRGSNVCMYGPSGATQTDGVEQK